MNSQWILVVLLWGIIIGIAVVSVVSTARQTSEQRRAEIENTWEQQKKQQKEEARKVQQTYRKEPAKGCLQRMFEYALWSTFLMIVLIVCILLLIMTFE